MKIKRKNVKIWGLVPELPILSRTDSLCVTTVLTHTPSVLISPSITDNKRAYREFRTIRTSTNLDSEQRSDLESIFQCKYTL